MNFGRNFTFPYSGWPLAWFHLVLKGYKYKMSTHFFWNSIHLYMHLSNVDFFPTQGLLDVILSLTRIPWLDFALLKASKAEISRPLALCGGNPTLSCIVECGFHLFMHSWSGFRLVHSICWVKIHVFLTILGEVVCDMLGIAR